MESHPEATSGVSTSATHACDHFVQFYDTQDQLLQSLRSYITIGLRRGETVFSIASTEHQRLLEELLSIDGDMEGARRHGRYIAVDAERLLERFMVDGMPDPDRFARVVNALLRRPAREGRPIRGFAEMVALLWRSGQYDAALRLEELWDTMAREFNLVLYCAYPSECFANGRQPGCAEVSCRHTRILPADPAEARIVLTAG
jgi:hypothetical protein